MTALYAARQARPRNSANRGRQGLDQQGKADPRSSWTARLRESRYWLLVFAVACQLATLLITWPVWNLRDDPVNLPLLPLPEVSFGPLILLSLAATLIWPRAGVIAHAAVFAASLIWDQFRLQPQVLSLIVLMFACVFDVGAWFARWYLAAMWLWAGLHKFLSAEWFGCMSWWFVNRCGLPADDWHVPFAIVVAVAEGGLGLVAIIAPKRAAAFCVLMHVGILASLALLGAYNVSVWPWNLATAIIGAWVLKHRAVEPAAIMRRLAVAMLFLSPVGFFAGLVNPHLAFVLYSGNMPGALHTTPESAKRLDGWVGLSVPFPDSPRLFVQVFEQTGAPGDKLHVADPRPWLPDRYFVKAEDGTVREVPRERFRRGDVGTGELAGLELDPPNTVWRLARWGVKLRSDSNALVYSATIDDARLGDEVLRGLAQLPNLRELKIDGAAVTDDGVAALASLPELEIVEVKHCHLTDASCRGFAQIGSLRWLHLEDVRITRDCHAALRRMPHLMVLHLPATGIDDRCLAAIGSLSNLEWLDVSDTAVTGQGLAHLTRLDRCQWINLSGTAIDDNSLLHLQRLKSLEVVEVARTKIGDRGLAHLSQLTGCRSLDLRETAVTAAGLEQLTELAHLKTLDLRGTQVTPADVKTLQKSLPGCRIEW